MNKVLDKIKKAMFVTEDDDDTEQIDTIDDQLEDIIEKNSNIEMIDDSKEEAVIDNGFITLEREEDETVVKEETVPPTIEKPQPYFYKKESTAVKANEYKPTRIISPVYGVLQPNMEVNTNNAEKKVVYSTEAIVSPIYGKGVRNEEQPKSYFEKVNEELPKETEYDKVFTQPETEQLKPTEPIKEIIPEKFKQPAVTVVKVEQPKVKENTQEYQNLSIFDF